MKKLLFIIWLISFHSDAHQYFFALTEMKINQHTEELEIIHELSAHDIENAIALGKNIDFSSENENYEGIIKNYLASNFQLYYKKTALEITWVGLERIFDKLVIYQVCKKQKFFTGLVVKNNILVDTYPKQVNTVNYQSTVEKGSLTFSTSQRIASIK